MPLYRVLTSAPQTVPTGEKVRLPSGDEVRFQRVAAWIERGTVQAQDEFAALDAAKRIYGGSPVIAPALH
jgi:hypothetical protein